MPQPLSTRVYLHSYDARGLMHIVLANNDESTVVHAHLALNQLLPRADHQQNLADVTHIFLTVRDLRLVCKRAHERYSLSEAAEMLYGRFEAVDCENLRLGRHRNFEARLRTLLISRVHSLLMCAQHRQLLLRLVDLRERY